MRFRGNTGIQEIMMNVGPSKFTLKIVMGVLKIKNNVIKRQF
jgi:hypothetical protein